MLKIYLQTNHSHKLNYELALFGNQWPHTTRKKTSFSLPTNQYESINF